MRISNTIGELLADNAGSAHDFDVKVNYEGSDVVVVANDDVRHEFEYFYNTWKMFTRGDSSAAEYAYLVFCFSEYCKETQNSLNRIYSALYNSYDPTCDYSRHETTAYKNTRETEYGKSTNTANSNSGKTTYNSTTSEDTTTFDSQALRPATETTHGGYDTQSLNSSIATSTDGTDTTTDTRLPDDNIIDVEGNNNSPQKSISDEIQLRIHNNFTDIVIKGFVDKYLFLLA